MMLSLDTAYRSFGGEVEASSTPTICRLPDSRRHQLWAIARDCVARHLSGFGGLLQVDGYAAYNRLARGAGAARRPNPGRGSTYRRGNFVQTTGTSSNS